MKQGRNELCSCGSGKKYKFCHGHPSRSDGRHAFAEAFLRRRGALELQRERQQGLGKPIVSGEFKGLRVVAVRSKVYFGKWRTFPDFLLHYIREVLGNAWIEAQLLLPDGRRHLAVRWLSRAEAHKAEARQQQAGPMFSTAMTGAVAAYLGLAYDLYTIAHNAERLEDENLQAKLVARLKHVDQFMGARHEVRVAALLLRAGFALRWEDESDRRRRHCEFTATYPPSGKSFGVEVKIRQPPPTRSAMPRPKFNGLLVDALRKETPHARMIFIDLNTPARATGTEEWCQWAARQCRKVEHDRTTRDLPPAYVILTSYPYHHHLEDEDIRAFGIAEGFRIADFKFDHEATLREAIESRERHAEMEAVLASLQRHTDIPDTFDGELPGLPIASRILVGGRYRMSDGRTGVVTTAAVDPERGRCIVGFLGDDGEGGIVYESQLSPDELNAWKRFPDSFFGQDTSVRQSKSPLDLYDFFRNSYKNTSKERLLELMAHWRNVEELRSLPRDTLADLYSESCVNSVIQMHKGSPEA